MRCLDGKVVVVCAGGTGSSRLGASIGCTTARRLAAEGAKVVVGDLDLGAAESSVALIRGDGGTAVAQRYDAGSDGDTAVLMQRAVDEFGGLHGVHFNATDPEATHQDGEFDVTDVPLELFHRVLDIGLVGFVLAARHAVPHLLDQGGGAIVGTSSGAAYVGMDNRVSYACAKAGMGAVVRHIASRFGNQGIRANLVSPGFVPSTAMLDEPSLQHNAAHPRSHRLGRPDDIAAMVALLLSDDGEWVQGQAMVVDGGTVMRP
jgi:NAD(P)-dependent dehydrogenase (short-subunit alcohol dehydrogenase family)